MRTTIPTLPTVVAVLSLLATATLRADQQLLENSIKEVRAETLRTKQQLESTLGALNTLTAQAKGDLRPAYQAFAAEIPKTQAASDWTRSRVKSMNENGQKYFDGWQKELDGISNQSLRKKAQSRMDSVKKSYNKVIASLTTASEKFAPFLSDLSDIQKTLANDITPGGIKAIRGTVNSANWNYKSVNRAVNEALTEMDKMAKALSPEAVK